MFPNTSAIHALLLHKLRRCSELRTIFLQYWFHNHRIDPCLHSMERDNHYSKSLEATKVEGSCFVLHEQYLQKANAEGVGTPERNRRGASQKVKLDPSRSVNRHY